MGRLAEQIGATTDTWMRGDVDGPMAQAIAHRLEALDAARPKPVSDLRQNFSAGTAHSCGRKRAFKLWKITPDAPTDWRQKLTFDVGHMLHERLQDVVVNTMGGVIEQPTSWAPVAPLWGWADAWVDLFDTGRFDTVGEFKSCAPYSYEKAVGRDKWGKPTTPEGPKVEHITQAALYALAPSLPQPFSHLWLVYVNKAKPEMTEWIIGVDDPLPIAGGRTPRDLANDEVAAVNEIQSTVDAGLIPERTDGAGQPIHDPMATRFPCGWCDYQLTCSDLPTGPCSSVELLEKHLAAAPAAPTPDNEEEEDNPW